MHCALRPVAYGWALWGVGPAGCGPCALYPMQCALGGVPRTLRRVALTLRTHPEGGVSSLPVRLPLPPLRAPVALLGVTPAAHKLRKLPVTRQVPARLKLWHPTTHTHCYRTWHHSPGVLSSKYDMYDSQRNLYELSAFIKNLKKKKKIYFVMVVYDHAYT